MPRRVPEFTRGRDERVKICLTPFSKRGKIEERESEEQRELCSEFFVAWLGEGRRHRVSNSSRAVNMEMMVTGDTF